MWGVTIVKFEGGGVSRAFRLEKRLKFLLNLRSLVLNRSEALVRGGNLMGLGYPRLSPSGVISGKRRGKG